MQVLSAIEQLDQNESDYSRIRILELKLRPVDGQFDVAHLKEINRRILQDMPSYNGGELMLNLGEHTRSRHLSDQSDSYVVHYKYGKITESCIDDAISNLGPIDALPLLSKPDFCTALSTLYADLDHIHAFNEGNSRTLRIFTEQIAQKAGYVLDWTNTNGGENVRDVLYQARDIEVSKRSHPNLTIGGMRDATHAQMDAYTTQKRLANVKTLMSIFSENMTPLAYQKSPTKNTI